MARTIPGASAQTVKRKQYLYLAIAAAVVVVVALVAGYVTESKKPQLPVADTARPAVKNIAVPGDALKEEQSWRAIEGARVEALAKEVTGLRAENESMRKEMTTRASALPANVVPPPQRSTEQPSPLPPATSNAPLPRLPPPPSRQGATPSGTLADPGDSPSRPAIATVSFDDDQNSAGGSQRRGGKQPAAQAPTARTEVPPSDGHGGENYLPAGTFMKGVLLNGLDAPTGGQAQQNPQPVLIRIVGDAVMPNQFRAAMRGCFMTSNFYGDLSSERALGRGDRLICLKEDGGAIDVALRAYVVGPDGKVGLAGRVVSKSNKLLANAAIAGVLSGLASVAEAYSTVNSVSALGTVQTIDSNKIPQYAAASGIQTAADKLSSYYLKLADQMLPTVEVPTGVAVDIVLQKGMFLDTTSR